jgi:hypothetical protein
MYRLKIILAVYYVFICQVLEGVKLALTVSPTSESWILISYSSLTRNLAPLKVGIFVHYLV